MVQEKSLKISDNLAARSITVIAGPTASGKSAAALELAASQGGVIISADSMQIYKGMDIGTAKPTRQERAKIAHYMIDVVDVDKDYSVGDYVQDTLRVIGELPAEVPIFLVGGTGLYIKSLLYEHSFASVPGDKTLREELKNQAALKGSQFLYEQLLKVDKVSASSIHHNDIKRIIRALEIYRLTGEPKSAHKDRLTPRFKHRMFVINPVREELYKRIEVRADQMIDDGLLDEIKTLVSAGAKDNMQSMQAIGYKEGLKYLNQKISLLDMLDEIKKNTRNYAKRQITFFKQFKEATWVEKGADIPTSGMVVCEA